MKKLFLLLPLLFSMNLFAQPVPNREMLIEDFNRMSKELENEPDNNELIWQRLMLTTPIQFNLPQKGGVIKDSKTDTVWRYSTPVFPDWNYEDRLLDINKLIERKAEVKEYDGIVDIADFRLLRGKLHYLLGAYEEALSDYLFALNNMREIEVQRNNYLKKNDICMSIAAYYYNRVGYPISENAGKALEYIDKISLVEFAEDYNDEKLFNYYDEIRDHYKEEKIVLLTDLKDESRLESYYKKLIANQYEIFKRSKEYDEVWNTEKVEKEGYDYKTNENYLSTLNYIHDLADFYYTRKKYKLAYEITKQALSHYPRNAEGYVIDKFNASRHYLLMNKIYQTEEYEDFDEEINCIFDILDPSYGINYDVTEIGGYLEGHLKKYPKEGRLYLAVAMWHYKNRTQRPTASTKKILDLLEKAKSLECTDYRLPFTKALVHIHMERDYELGLSELNKALKLNQKNSYLYGTKFHLLRKFPNPDEQELHELSDKLREMRRNRNYQSLDGFLEML